MHCDFCKSNNIKEIYIVPTSRIGATIYCCQECGLHQSKYTDKSNKHTHKSISSGADWGNIRHGKKIRLQKSLDVLNSLLDFNSLPNILDIGSNRGHFVNYIIDNTKSNVTAIEPDTRIVGGYVDDSRLTKVFQRYENCNLDHKFDLIYCCHTLEHADSAFHMITQMRNNLKEKGYLYIDVPSIEILKDVNNVEEFFIDKHTFHFDIDVLSNFLKFLGFKIIYSEDDKSNIIIVCQKINKHYNLKDNIDYYHNNMIKNQTSLKQIVEIIHDLCKNNRVAIYGTSKIYDALVIHGGLNPNLPEMIIDDYLYGYVDKVHGRELTKSSNLLTDKVDIIILLTRSATDNLIKTLTDANFQNIITFKQLINKK